MSEKKKPFYSNTQVKAGTSPRAADYGPRSVLADSLIGDIAIPLSQAIAAGISGKKEQKEKAVDNIKEKSEKIEKDARQRGQTAKLEKIQSSQASKYTTAKKKAGGSIKQTGHNRLY